MNQLAQTAYLGALSDLRHATRAADRSAVVKRVAATLKVSEQTVYRNLHAMGWESGRAPRRDKGQTELGREEMERLACMMAKARNKRGQPNLPTSEAHRIAGENGWKGGDLSYGYVARRLREEGLGMRAMCAPEAAVKRCSQHPNHVWFFDISVAIQWYFRDPESGEKLDLYSDAGSRFYAGKRENFTASKKVIHRYTVTDHYSGCYFVQYYYTPGERAEDVVDFLWNATRPKDELGMAAFPFRGLPRRLVMDQGPANKSALVANLLDELDIIPEWHAPRNAKASGSVESRHNAWQRSFEGRLAQHPVSNIGELNTLAARFSALATAERDHTRHGRPPLHLWASILPEQLRESPPRAVFFQLANTNPQERTLTNELYLQAGGRKWQVTGDNVHPRMKVLFRYAPFRDQGIRVWDQQGRELAALAISFDEAGQPENGLRHEWDNEDAKGASQTPAPGQVIAQAVARKERVVELDLGQVFGDLEGRLARQAVLAPKGKAWDAKDTAASAEPIEGSVELRLEASRKLGRPLTVAEGQWWKAAIGDGLTRTAFQAAWEEFISIGDHAAREAR